MRGFRSTMVPGSRSACARGLALGLVLASVGCGPRGSLVPDTGALRRDAAVEDAFAWTNCQPGETRCTGEVFQRCVASGEFSAVENTDCAARGEQCVVGRGCLPCRPDSLRCTDEADAVERCRSDGSGYERAESCDVENGVYCRGERCRSLCDNPEVLGSNVGCEYFAVDLDNAQLGAGESAASQQYAIVVSNPDERFSARVRIEANRNPPGMPPAPFVVSRAVIPPLDLEVFPLPPREVDCSPPGEFNTGTGTCLSSQAYRVISTAPVIAAQFNPLTNDLVFSNDASLLIPTNSLSGEYTVLGWPQTLASRPPETVLNPMSPVDLRAFVTIVGTAEGTTVRLLPRTSVLTRSGPMAPRFPAGSPFEVTLGPFDVLNVETDGFEADLTGSTVTASRPVAVFAGSECSDVPEWFDLNDRRCCCDHLEAQLFPRATLGRRYVAVHTPNRTQRVRAAGGPVGLVTEEPEFFRVLAVGPGTTHVRTTLEPGGEGPDAGSTVLEFDLPQNQHRTLRATSHFQLEATQPVAVANFMSSQTNTGIPLEYPGGDGSYIPMPSIEQWRDTYVFLTPDKYAFDFVMIVAPPGATVSLDGDTLPTEDCEAARADGCVPTRLRTCPPSQYTVYSCQLSYPMIVPGRMYPENVLPGRQRDGVHVVRASVPVGVIVSGFDLRVSYGYPAGTQLRPLM